jgi:hypothetical protein
MQSDAESARGVGEQQQLLQQQQQEEEEGMCAVGPRELLATSILPFVVRGGGHVSASGLRALGVTMASHLPPQCDYCRDSADVAALAMHAGAVLRVPAGAPSSPQESCLDGTTFPHP